MDFRLPTTKSARLLRTWRKSAVNSLNKPSRNQLFSVVSIAKSVVEMLIEAAVVPIKSVLTPQFGQNFKKLSPDIKKIVHEKYHRWRKDPSTLKFEPKFYNYFVVEITRKIHAIASVASGVVTWLAIGDYTFYTGYLDAKRKH
jgi:hypothetical protein